MKKFLVLFVFTQVLFFGCNKEEGVGSKRIYVKLTDAPGDYDQVNIDLKEVVVKTNAESSDWQSLTTEQGIYDLLQLQNGVDTSIASGSIEGTELKEIRLVLGDSNSIMVDSILHDLTIPSGSTSGLKIKLKDVEINLDSLTIDFDAALSVHETGNGNYHLKPVIKIK